VEALAVVGFKVRVRRRSPEVVEIVHKVVVENDQRKCALGCSSKPSGTSTMRWMNIDRPRIWSAPRSECGCGDVLGVGRRGMGGITSVSAMEIEAPGLTVTSLVSRSGCRVRCFQRCPRPCPVQFSLSFRHCGGKVSYLFSTALDPLLARRNVLEAANRIAPGGCVHHRGLGRVAIHRRSGQDDLRNAWCRRSGARLVARVREEAQQRRHREAARLPLLER